MGKEERRFLDRGPEERLLADETEFQRSRREDCFHRMITVEQIYTRFIHAGGIRCTHSRGFDCIRSIAIRLAYVGSGLNGDKQGRNYKHENLQKRNCESVRCIVNPLVICSE